MFLQVSYPTFIIYYRQWEILTETLTRLNWWDKLDLDIRSSTLCKLFGNTLSKFIRSAQWNTSNTNDSAKIKLLRKKLLPTHQFRQRFRDILNLIRACLSKPKPHYFLRCCIYNANRYIHMNDLNEIDSSFSVLTNSKFIDLLLYGKDRFIDKNNCCS